MHSTIRHDGSTNNNEVKHSNLDNSTDDVINAFDIKYLLSISDDIFQYHFLQYLSIKDIGRLDNAVTNIKHRYQYLEKIANSILRNSDSYHRMNNSRLKWLNNKKSFQNTVLSESIIINLREVFRYCEGLHVMKGNLFSLVILQCRKLKRLTLAAVHDDDIFLYDGFPKRYNGLQSLNLEECINITDESIISVSKNCTGLQSLNLCGCSKITDESIISISKNCFELEILNLMGCIHITDASIISISNNCIKLRTLNLCICRNITDESIFSISKYCTRLRELSLGGCIHITDESIISVSKTCTGLQSLYLFECSNITDESIISISKNCTGLQSLNLFRCSNITDESIKSIFKNCINLQTLSLFLCNNISNALRKEYLSMRRLQEIMASL